MPSLSERVSAVVRRKEVQQLRLDPVASAERTAAMVRMKGEGQTNRAIARFFNINASRVGQLLKANAA